MCPLCTGLRYLVHYTRLDIVWQNRVTESVLESTSMPPQHSIGRDTIRQAGGSLMLSEENYQLGERQVDEGIRVNDKVHEASNQLLRSSRDPNSLLLRQKLECRGVPVYEISYNSGAPRTLWIFGTDRRVFSPGYPKSPFRIAALVILILLVIAAFAGLIVYFGVLRK